MRHSFLRLLLFFPVFGEAQISDTVYNDALYNYNAGDMEILLGQSPISVGARTIDLGYEGFKGSPYLWDAFQSAHLQLKASDTLLYSSASVKLDMHRHEILLALENKEQTLVLNGAKVHSVEFAESKRLFRVFSKEERSDRGANFTIAEVLLEGPIDLVKVRYQKFRKADYGSAYGNTGQRYDALVTEERYYVRQKPEPFVRIRLHWRKLVRELPAYTQPIKENQQAPLVTETDLIQFLTEISK